MAGPKDHPGWSCAAQVRLCEGFSCEMILQPGGGKGGLVVVNDTMIMHICGQLRMKS
jgi:hypothetical protein